MPKQPIDLQSIFTDPNFLSGIAQITAGVAGAGSMGQAIGESNRFRQRQELDESQLEQQKSYQDRQLEAAQNRDYLTLVKMQEEDYDKRKVAALQDIKQVVDGMDPTEYAKLPEILPNTLAPYQLRKTDIEEIRSNALGRIQAKDYTTYDPNTGERNVPVDRPNIVYVTRKEGILAEQQFKKEAATRKRDEETQRKTHRAELIQNLTLAAQTPGAAEALLKDLDPNLLDLPTAQGIVSGARAEVEKKQTQQKAADEELKLKALREQQLQASIAAQTAHTAKLNDELRRIRVNGELTPGQLTAANSMAGRYEGISKRFFELRDAYNQIATLGARGTAAGDLGLIFSFMKLLDPPSTVREGEQAMASNAAGVPDKIRNFYNKLLTGKKLTPEQTKDFVATAKQIFSQFKSQQEGINKEFTKRAETAGIPDFMVIRDIEPQEISGGTDDIKTQLKALIERAQKNAGAKK